jgi:hypothetical protein
MQEMLTQISSKGRQDGTPHIISSDRVYFETQFKSFESAVIAPMEGAQCTEIRGMGQDSSPLTRKL